MFGNKMKWHAELVMVDKMLMLQTYGSLSMRMQGRNLLVHVVQLVVHACFGHSHLYPPPHPFSIHPASTLLLAVVMFVTICSHALGNPGHVGDFL
jgi:hypothetical protein